MFFKNAFLLVCLLLSELTNANEETGSSNILDWDIELSNETYVQTGFDDTEFPKWVLIDLELEIGATYQLGSEINVISGISVGAGHDALESEYELEEIYVGLEVSGNRIGFGRKEYATEEFALDIDVDFGRQNEFEQVEDRGRNVIFLEREFKQGEFIATTDFSSDTKSFDIYAKFDLTDKLAIGFSSQYFKQDGDTITTNGISLSHQFGKWEAHYALTDNERQTGADIGFEKKWERGHKLAASCGFEKSKIEDRFDTLCFANYSHALTEYLYVNVEFGAMDIENTKDYGYLLGLELEFE